MARYKKFLKTKALEIRLFLPKAKTEFRTSMKKSDFFSFANESAPTLDTDLRFAFFSHNKIAQTSINRNLLSSRALISKDSMNLWNVALKKYERMWDVRQPFVFTIVRNPYTRTMSAFYYLKKIGKIGAKRQFDEFMQSDFLDVGPAFDPHFDHQEKFSVPIAKMGFDKVLRIEEISDQWPSVAAIIKSPSTLPQSNKTEETKDILSMQQRTRQIIEETYAKDFAGLGYQIISE
ncbi:sulfotransferase family 2 domain-containing protein [Rhizobium sp. PAMB 3174]